MAHLAVTRLPAGARIAGELTRKSLNGANPPYSHWSTLVQSADPGRDLALRCMEKKRSGVGNAAPNMKIVQWVPV